MKGTALIVAPASLTYNWLAEVKRFAPTLNVQVVSGNRQERAALLQNSTEDILITLCKYATRCSALSGNACRLFDFR